MSQWAFLSHHGHVLLAIGEDPDITIDKLAAVVGVTTRSIVNILRDLEQGGYVRKEKAGRKNHYELSLESQLRHQTSSNRTVGELVTAIGRVAQS
jgi:DNA-binding MarR family transcriptional regulator